MNADKVSRVYELVLNAAQVYNVENDAFVVGEFDDVVGDAENEVMRFHWDDEVGNEFVVHVTEAGLDAAVVKGNDLVLIDSEGDEFTVRLFAVVRIELTADFQAA
jgi:hypothetical protein